MKAKKLECVGPARKPCDEHAECFIAPETTACSDLPTNGESHAGQRGDYQEMAQALAI